MAVKIVTTAGAPKKATSVPKVSIGGVIAVAKAFVDGGPLTRDGIAAKLDVKPGTGSANNRVIAAKMFGIIQRNVLGGYVLTPLGRRFLKGTAGREDIVEAIRNVPHFAALLDHFDSDPATVAESDIRRAFVKVGVPAADLSTATRIFMNSWRYRHPSAPTTRKPKAGAASPQTEAKAASSPDLVAAEPADGGSAPAIRATAPGARRAMRITDVPLVSMVLAEAPPLSAAWSSDEVEQWIRSLTEAVRLAHLVQGRKDGKGE